MPIFKWQEHAVKISASDVILSSRPLWKRDSEEEHSKHSSPHERVIPADGPSRRVLSKSDMCVRCGASPSFVIALANDCPLRLCFVHDILSEPTAKKGPLLISEFACSRVPPFKSSIVRFPLCLFACRLRSGIAIDQTTLRYSDSLIGVCPRL